MFTLTVQNHKGEQLNLTESPMYEVLRVDGLNPPPATLNFTELANFDGSKYNSGQLTARNLVITLRILPDIETNRINLYKYFPSKQNIRIYWENDTRKVFIDGRVETFECPQFEMVQKAVISIICPDPYWREETPTQLNFSNVIDLFEFPFSIEAEGIEISRLERLATAVFVNSEIETGITVELQATASQILNPRIVNRTTSEYFGLNVDMNEGDIIRINTRRGEKSAVLVRGGQQTNIIGRRMSGSKWVQLVAGVNELSYECDNGAENLIVRVYTHRLFGGV